MQTLRYIALAGALLAMVAGCAGTCFGATGGGSGFLVRADCSTLSRTSGTVCYQTSDSTLRVGTAMVPIPITLTEPISARYGASGYTGSVAVQACTRWAATNGSGTTCSSASPCTAAQALSGASAGSVVCLNDGTYAYVSGGGVLNLPNVGTLAQPLWVRPTNVVQVIGSDNAAHTPNVKLTVNGANTKSAVYAPNVSNYIVDGFEMDGTGHIGSAGAINSGANSLTAGLSHMLFLNNYIHDWGGSGIACNDADYCWMIGNVVHHVASTDTYCDTGIGYYESVNFDRNPGWHDLIIGNIVHDVQQPGGGATCKDGNGIFAQDDGDITQNDPKIPYTGDTLVENNIAYNNAGACIKSYATTHTNILIRNNTCYQNGIVASVSGMPEGGTGEIIAQAAAHVIAVNNIVQPNPTGNSGHNVGLGEWGDAGSFLTAGNMCYAPSGQKCWASTVADTDPALNNFFGVNPLWSNPGSADFTLQATSPAIRKGLTMYGQPIVDILGKSRVPSQVDLGAYVSGAAGIPYWSATSQPNRRP